MLIDGKAIADQILAKLSKDVFVLKARNITPTLAVILVGDDPASLAYIKQKQKAADFIGARVVFSHLSSDIIKRDLQQIITQYNNDPNIHGFIIQRPVPDNFSHILIYEKMNINKDVDGFLPNSPFSVPVAIAVEEILQNAKCQTRLPDGQVLNAKCVVIGRGETAGKPIADHLMKLGFTPTIIHSQTPNPEQIIKSADIIISCVGKEKVITSENITQGVILISVGIWRDELGKLHGDYDETDIESKASYYTPTPKGIGPVNVACLMQNLIKACMIYACPPSHKASAGLRFATPKQ